MREGAARAFVPDEIVPAPSITYPLKQSLRLLRQGKIQGWVDAMMASGPEPIDTAMRKMWEARHRANAEQHYAEHGQ